MESVEGIQLAKQIRRKAAEFKAVCEGIDEETASRAPEGRWSPKQIVSHLSGPEGPGYLSTMSIFLEQENPQLDLDPGNPFLSEKRGRMSFAELLAELDKEYDRIAVFVGGLSPEQLQRKANIPLLKETPIGEYPTLAAWIQGITDYHLDFHIDHMKEIRQALGV
jgi:hypothetical protein